MDDICSLVSLYSEEYPFNHLYQLVVNGLETELDIRLSQLDDPTEYLTSLGWYDGLNISLLMTAAIRGYDNITRLLLKYLNQESQVELKGSITIPDGNHINGATALYCACYYSYFNIAKTLIEIGKANVHQTTYDYHSYPLLFHAIQFNRLDIIRFLVENKYVNINDVNYNSLSHSSALIFAVEQQKTLIAEYLIQNGADINYHIENAPGDVRTALGCAIESRYVEIIRILFNLEADCGLRNQSSAQSIDYLQTFEIAICSKINFQDDNFTEYLRNTLEMLKLPVERRQSTNSPLDSRSPIAIYNFERECETVDELDSIKCDESRMILELLMKCERLFLSSKIEMVMKPFHDYGASLVMSGEYDRCFDLWIHMFYVHQSSDHSLGLHVFVWIFCRMFRAQQPIHIQRFFQISQLVFESHQGREVPFLVYNAVFLVIIGIQLLESDEITNEDRKMFYRWIKQLCRQPLVNKTGQGIIHLCANSETADIINYRRSDIHRYFTFPHEIALRLLLTCGRQSLDLDLPENSDGSTPLHIACQSPANINIIKLLLDSGCHADCVNKAGKTPRDFVKDQGPEILFKYQSINPKKLKCICSCLIARRASNVNIYGTQKSYLNKFIVIHGGHHVESQWG